MLIFAEILYWLVSGIDCKKQAAHWPARLLAKCGYPKRIWGERENDWTGMLNIARPRRERHAPIGREKNKDCFAVYRRPLLTIPDYLFILNTAPLVQSCTKLIMPSCSYLGYTHTTQTEDLQRILDNVLKGKLRKFGNHSVCSPTLKKIFCAEFAPPCFPQDKTETVLRTVCKSECENVQIECPDLYKEHFGEYSYCEQMATEKSDLDGFCKLTKWPTAVRWPLRPIATSKFPRQSHLNNSSKIFI